MSPANAKIMCGTIAATLKTMNPSHAETIDANLAKYRKELSEADEAIAKELKPYEGGTFFVFHDAFGYFGDRYGMRQKAIEMGGKQPSAKRLAELIEEAKSRRVKVIFVQPQYSTRSAEAIAKAIGGAVVAIDPLSPDYVKNLREISTKISRAMRAARSEAKR
jgi:zinc transport system substrate-binding protein